MDAATKAAQAEARSKTKTPAGKTPAKIDATPATVAAQPTKPAEPAPAKHASLFDVSVPAAEEAESAGDEGYTPEPEESEELDEAA
jgi:hypothetical protein